MLVLAPSTFILRHHTCYGTTPKPEECGDGRCLSCTSFVGLEHATMIVVIRNKLSLAKKTLRTLLRKSRSVPPS